MDADLSKGAVIRRAAFYSTLSNYIGQFVVVVTGFLLTPFVLNQLGPSSYGLWVLIGSVIAYGGLFDLGITDAVIKYVAEYRAKGEVAQVQGVIATALLLYTLLGLLVVILAALLAPIFPTLFRMEPADHATARWLVFLMGLALGISLPCTTSHTVLRGLQRFDLANLISITGTLVSALATVIVLLLGGDLLGMVLVTIPITLVMQVPTIWFIKRTVPGIRIGWHKASYGWVRTLLGFSSSVFVIQVAGRLQNKTDEIVISALLPISAVTPYNISRRLSETAQLLTRQFLKILLPLASSLHAENDQGRLRELYLTSSRLTLASFLPLGCVVAILAQPLLTVWVGAAYGGYAHLVQILTLSSLIGTSQWPASSVLLGIARHRPMALMALGSGIANLVLSILLAQRFGLTGIALGTLIPTTIESLFFLMPYTARTIGVSAREAWQAIYWPALLPALPTALVLYLLQLLIEPTALLALAVIAGLGVLTYIATYLSVTATPLEREIVQSAAWRTFRFAQSQFKQWRAPSPVQ